MLLYHCINCSTRFESDVPACPKCPTDARQEEYKDDIGNIPFVHFDIPHPVRKGRGKGEAACDGRKIGTWENGHPLMMSGERDAVNCEKCKETEVFKSNLEHGAKLHAKV